MQYVLPDSNEAWEDRCMFKKIFAAHQYKIILSTPIIFLVIVSSTGVLGVGNVFFFSTESKNFFVVGEQIPVTLEISTKTPVNAVGGTIFFSSDALFTIFFMRNFWMFSDLVNKGELDILLTKPVHPLFKSG